MADRVELKHVILDRDRESFQVRTTIKADGASCLSKNPGDYFQFQIADWVGCANDIERYNWEHEFIHSFIAEKMWDGVSYVVHMEAHGKRMNEIGAKFEERWCYHFHRYLNGVGPALEPEWEGWREDARKLLHG